MSQNENPSGRAAYEAWWRTAKGVPRPPDVSYDEDRNAWNAAAAAAVWATPLYAELARQLAAVTADLDDLTRQLKAWPTCPDGCGCRLGTEDADRRDCACDGPCCIECRENGYPDAPSYRDIPRAGLEG